MFRATVRLALISVFVCIPTGCKNFSNQTTTQFTKMDESRESYGEHFTYMVDNAILRDMSLADIHFIAHTTELSGVGAIRLKRMAKLLNTYGGTIRLDTQITDEILLDERMEHVREFLTLSGCEIDYVEIDVSAPGGRGMSGVEGVAKYQRSVAPSSSEDGAALGGLLSNPGN